jgi:dephospho-CoA kinase
MLAGVCVLKVGLTGAIASGKTTVARMFAARGAHVIYADNIAHELMEPGQPAYEQVVRAFGRGILNPDLTIHRQKLADLAFGTPAHPSGRVQELNAIVHPAVVQLQDDWMIAIGRRDPNAVAMVEAALMIEAGAHTRFDRLVVVTCPFATRLRRWMSRTNMDEVTARQELERRMAAQLPEEEKVKLADFVLDNSGDEASTEAQVRDVYAQLRQMAART